MTRGGVAGAGGAGTAARFGAARLLASRADKRHLLRQDDLLQLVRYYVDDKADFDKIQGLWRPVFRLAARTIITTTLAILEILRNQRELISKVFFLEIVRTLLFLQLNFINIMLEG